MDQDGLRHPPPPLPPTIPTLVTSPLDDCCSFLSLPLKTIRRLQIVQIVAARIISNIVTDFKKCTNAENKTVTVYLKLELDVNDQLF